MKASQKGGAAAGAGHRIDPLAARSGPPPATTFFTAAERTCAAALIDHLTGQYREPRVPVLQLIETRLAAGETPGDGQAWRDTLSDLDADARVRCGAAFAAAAEAERHHLIQAVRELGAHDWHGRPAAQVWTMWTRYACTAFYSHPAAWAEIGFQPD